MICRQCNFFNEIGATKCANCGCGLLDYKKNNEDNPRRPMVADSITNIEYEEVSNRKWGVVLVLCILLGLIGFHRFYVGKAGTAILMLLTLGGFGIWALVDLIAIIICQFTDEDGKKIKRVKKALR